MKSRIKYIAIGSAHYSELARMMNHYNHPCVVAPPIRDKESSTWQMIISYVEPVEEQGSSLKLVA